MDFDKEIARLEKEYKTLENEIARAEGKLKNEGFLAKAPAQLVEQEREKLINQAQAEYNKVIPRALGEAQQTIQEAEGYALQRVNEARGDSARFTALYDEYRKAPDVTRTRMYLETMAKVLPQVEGKVVVDADLRSVLPLLNLDAGQGQGQGGQR